MRYATITLCLLVLLAGCGGTAGSESTTTTPQATATPAQTTVGATPTPESTAPPTADPPATETPDATATEPPVSTVTPAERPQKTRRPEPTPTPARTATATPTATEGPVEVNRSVFRQHFETRLEMRDWPYDMDIRSVEYSGTSITVRYSVQASNRTEFIQEVATVAFAYRNTIANTTGFQPTTAQVQPVANGVENEPFVIETAWAEAELAGEISEREYINNILGSAT